MVQRFDVVIVGAGIAGCALAAMLAPTGLKILLLEASALASVPPTPASAILDVDPRVSALSTASSALLEQVGAWQSIPPGAASPYATMRVWEEDGSGRIEFHAEEVGQPLLGHIVENRWIVAGLLACIAQNPDITLRDGQRLRSVERPADGGAAVAMELDSGERIECALLVGADGANSAVRKACGLSTRDHDCGQRAIVTTIETERAHERTAWQRFLQTGPLALLPLATLPGERACSIVWSADDARATELMALDEEAFARALESASEHCLGRVLALSRRFAFPLRQAHARAYVAPGIALIGDAAHVIHPLAGQGINLGFSDVRVLAEELARGRDRGLSPGDIGPLSRYERRRRGENAIMLRAMDGFRRLFGADRLELRLLRSIGMNAVHRAGPLKREFMRHAMGLG